MSHLQKSAALSVALFGWLSVLPAAAQTPPFLVVSAGSPAGSMVRVLNASTGAELVSFLAVRLDLWR